MATGFIPLTYAKLHEAYAFIRDCQAEGDEGVSSETYGTRPANGVIRPQLPIQERDPGYLSEDEIIDLIDARRNGHVEPAEDETDDDYSRMAEEFGVDGDLADQMLYDSDDGLPLTDGQARDFLQKCAQAHPAAVSVRNGRRLTTDIFDILPSRIGSRRHAYAIVGLDLFESRMSSHRDNATFSWKNIRVPRQYLRHACSLNCDS